MGRDVSVPLLIPVVFGDVVEVIPSDDDGPLHLGRDDDALEDLATDGDSTGEGTLLIDIVRLNSLLWSPEVETNMLVVSDTRTSLLCEQFFTIQKDVVLFLEGSLVLR